MTLDRHARLLALDRRPRTRRTTRARTTARRRVAVRTPISAADRRPRGARYQYCARTSALDYNEAAVFVGAHAPVPLSHVRILLRPDRQAVPAQSRSRVLLRQQAATSARSPTCSTASTRARASSSSPARSAPARRRSCAACSSSSTASKLVAAQLVSTQLDADDMLRAVAIAFGLPRAGRSTRRCCSASLEAFLCQLATRGQARAADRRRGAEPDAARGRGAAHAVELPARRPGAAAELPGRPAGVARR